MQGTPFKLGRRYIVLALAILLVSSGSWYLYFHILSAPVVTKKDLVGIITINEVILSSSTADKYTSIINMAVMNDSVKGIVVRVDCPGGYADLIEQVYLDLLVLKQKKPLVASITSALSGGYYIAVAADYIYTLPTSMVGNVGLIGVGPPVLIPSEYVLESGPQKVTGFSMLYFPFNLSHALDNFALAVMSNRGQRLKLPSAQLRRGLIYIGSEAISSGLVDEAGSLQKAIDRIAKEAKLTKYDVVDLNRAYEQHYSPTRTSSQVSVVWGNLTVEALNKINPPPALYYLYLPPNVFTKGLYYVQSSAQAPVPSVGGRGVVLIDRTHRNLVSAWEFNTLMGELTKRNWTMGFIYRWSELDNALRDASCLVVASPTIPYSESEVNRIEKFVNDGGKLLLFFDPASEYVEIPELFEPINTLSTRFGLSYAKGYLYNMEKHYGFYRNIYVRGFADHELTKNVSSIVLFTATHIYTSGKKAAWVTGNTYSSTAERALNYTTIAVVKENGTVIAFGDISFLNEPFCHVEDNYRLMQNLVSIITGITVKTEEGKEVTEMSVSRPELPVGAEKYYTEQVDGEEHTVRWLKVSEAEAVIERPNQTAHYYFDEQGALLRWSSDGMEARYETPIPEPPYPLTSGKSWRHESNYTLTIEDQKLHGYYVEEEEVLGFEDVKAGDGKSYFCVKVRYDAMDEILRDDTKIRFTSTGYWWASSDAGLVKDERATKTYVDDKLIGEETRKLILRTFSKG